jgi:hypothetical protein
MYMEFKKPMKKANTLIFIYYLFPFPFFFFPYIVSIILLILQLFLFLDDGRLLLFGEAFFGFCLVLCIYSESVLFECLLCLGKQALCLLLFSYLLFFRVKVAPQTLFKKIENAGRFLNILLSSAMIFLVFFIRKELFEGPIPLLAAILYSLLPAPIEWGPTVEPSTAQTFFLSLFMFLVLKFLKGGQTEIFYLLFPLLFLPSNFALKE